MRGEKSEWQPYAFVHIESGRNRLTIHLDRFVLCLSIHESRRETWDELHTEVKNAERAKWDKGWKIQSEMAAQFSNIAETHITEWEKDAGVN